MSDSLIKSRRNIWKKQEIMYFLKLMKQKKTLGFLNGKRIRTSEVFKDFERPMAEAGYPRECQSMQVKFKNLKSEYFRDVRGKTKGEFFKELDYLLRNYSLKSEHDVYEETDSIDPLLGPMYICTSDPSELSVGPSQFEIMETKSNVEVTSPIVTQAISVHSPPPQAPTSEDATSSTFSLEKSLDRFIGIQEEIKDTFVKYVAHRSNLIEKMLSRQEKIMMTCTKAIVSALKSKKRKKRKKARRRVSTSSSSSSTSSSSF